MEISMKSAHAFKEGGNFRIIRKHGDTSYQLHWHEYYEMILYRHCHGVCFLNGREYPIDGTCLFFLSPKDFHSIHAQNTPESRSIIISFYGDLLDAPLSEALKMSPRMLVDPPDFLVASVDALIRRAKAMQRWKHFVFADVWETHVLGAILAEVAERGEIVASDTPYLHSAIGKAIPYLLTDLSQSVSLTEISALCGLTPSYFSTLFRKEMGMSYTEWLGETRLAYAGRLLEESDLPVLDISLACGYNTASHFYRMFRRATGLSPSEYRERFRERKKRMLAGGESAENGSGEKSPVPKTKF